MVSGRRTSADVDAEAAVEAPSATSPVAASKTRR